MALSPQHSGNRVVVKHMGRAFRGAHADLTFATRGLIREEVELAR